jgi:signal transduction histidine kinase
VSLDDADAAMADAESARQRLYEMFEAGVETGSSPHLVEFLSPVDSVMSALDAGDYTQAKSLLTVELETAYIPLVESLQAELDGAQAGMEAHEAAGTRFSDFVRFFLTLAIPAGAVLVYRSVAKRQVKEYQLKAELEVEAERKINKAKDAFIAGLSHELRTPLTSIYGFAEVLTEESAQTPTSVGEISSIIATEAAEMGRMVDDLLVAARLDSTGVEVELEPTRVSDVVESAALGFERSGMTIQRRGSQAVVETDPARLRQVLVNLLSNAAKHGGSNVGVSISYGEDVVEIEVWDDGRGVADEQVEKLFDKFAHTGSTPLLTGSVGLGLAVASRLTRMLGGKLAYQRFNGKTYFVVTLPSQTAKNAPAATMEPTPLAAAVKALTA